MRSRALATAAVVVAALVATGIAGGPRSSVAAEPLRLTVGVTGPLGSLDITQADGAVARDVWALQYPTLTAFDLDTLEPVPSLAEAWSPTSDDASSWVYTLREDATWTDGVPLTAADVVYSIERARDEGWPYAGDMLHGIRAAVIDERTVEVFALERGRGALPSLPVHIVPAHVFRAGTDVGGGGVVGAGDWHVVERSEDAVRMSVVDRPGRPPVDEIAFRAFPDGDALLDALARGDVDVAGGIPPEHHERVRSLDGVTAIHANTGDQWVLQVRDPDANRRRAIARAVDRGRLVAEVAHGVGRTAVVPVVARAERWRLDAAETRAYADSLSYSPGEARRLLAASGPGAEPLRIAVPAGETAAAIAGHVRRALEALDLDVAVEAADDGADLVLSRRSPTDDPVGALAAYTCSGTVWCDDRFDAAFTVLTTTTDTADRRAAVREMVRRLADEAVEVVLFEPDVLQAFRTDRVIGLLREPDDLRLVVFWPSVEQYREVRPAQIPGGEEIPDSGFAVIAGAVAVAAIGALVLVARRHRRSSAPPSRRPAPEVP